MHHFSLFLHQRFVREMDIAVRDNQLSSRLIQNGVLHTNDLPEMMEYLYTLSHQFYLSQAVHWADVNGNFLSAEHDERGMIVSKIINNNIKPRTSLTLYRNKDGAIIKQVSSPPSSFDARKRPWYVAAQYAKSPIWSDVYLFEPDKVLGITIATPVYNEQHELRGVLGIDIKLDWISSYIAKQYLSPHSIIFVVTADGKLISYPKKQQTQPLPALANIHSLEDAWVSHSYDVFKKTGKTTFSFDYQGKSYLATYNVIHQFYHNNWLIAVVIPEDDFIGELKNARLMDIALGLIIMLSGLLLVSKLVSNVIRPMKSLIKETHKIKELDLDGDGRTPTRIKEIFYLSNSIHAMKNGLKAFRCYVPSALVKQLIQTGEIARLGGEKNG